MRQNESDERVLGGVDWITEYLAIGSKQDARSLTAGPASRVAAVLCLLPGCPCEDREDLQALDIEHVPLVDAAGNRPEEILLAVQFLGQCESHARRVLVHCRAGRSRSVAIVARHLMLSRAITASAALAHIAARRGIWLSPGIEEILHVELPT